MGEEPHYEYVEHDGKVLEELRRPLKGRASIDQVEFPGLGVYPRRKWFRVRAPRRKPAENFIPGYEARSFLHGLPSYVSTVHEDNYFTMYVTPVDRDHVFSLCALSGQMPPRERRWWSLYFRIWQLTHNTIFIGQDHRVLRQTELGPERLSAWDRDVVTWRRFAVQHARGYQVPLDAAGEIADLDDATGNMANGHVAVGTNGQAATSTRGDAPAAGIPNP
jgi:hypothetical protein